MQDVIQQNTVSGDTEVYSEGNVMSRFAENTSVSVAKTRAEIESTVMKYRGKSFGSMLEDDRAMVLFDMNNRRLRFILPLPSKADPKFKRSPGGRNWRTAEQTYEAWEQACRQRWRALLLSIRAKLEAVECGISTFEEEFLAVIVQNDGMTIGENLIPRLASICLTSQLPKLLPGPIEPEHEKAAG